MVLYCEDTLFQSLKSYTRPSYALFVIIAMFYAQHYRFDTKTYSQQQRNEGTLLLCA